MVWLPEYVELGTDLGLCEGPALEWQVIWEEAGIAHQVSWPHWTSSPSTDLARPRKAVPSIAGIYILARSS